MNLASLLSRVPDGRLRWLRVIGPVGLFLFLGGTTPGSVGSCADSDPTADFVEYCNAYEGIVCRRKQLSSEPCQDVPAGTRCYDAELCRPEAIARDCAAAADWPASCTPEPTVPEVELCFLVLTDPDAGYAFSVPEETIPECNLCP